MFVVTEFLLTTASRGPSAIAEPLVFSNLGRKCITSEERFVLELPTSCTMLATARPSCQNCSHLPFWICKHLIFWTADKLWKTNVCHHAKFHQYWANGFRDIAIFSARCNIYISHLCYDATVRLSVRLSVMFVHCGHRVQWITDIFACLDYFYKSTVAQTKMGHVSKTTPLLGVICHPFGKTWYGLPS